MKSGIPKLIILCVILAVLASNLIADVPTAINYQGRLTDVIAGKPVEDGDYVVTFRIYEGMDMGANLLWLETDTVSTVDGLFDLSLGAKNPISDAVFDGSVRYLGLQLEGHGEMYPRMPFLTVPYAFRSSHADSATFAFLAAEAAHSDTSAYAAFACRAANSDSAAYVALSQQAIWADSANYAMTAAWSQNSDSANYADLTGQAILADTSNIALTIVDNAITSEKIADTSIGFDDINQNNALPGQVMKWNGSTWIAADDSIQIGQDADWVISEDNMSSGVSGNVGIGIVNPSQKLDVDGNVRASGKLLSGNSIEIDGNAGKIITSTGILDFDDDDLTATGKILIGPGNASTGASASVLGESNYVNGDWASIMGGRHNMAHGLYSVVCGGGGETAYDSNSAVGNYAFIGSGHRNVVSGECGVIGGGQRNIASQEHALVGGGYFNQATDQGAAILGGSTNRANGVYSCIGGGMVNHANGSKSVVAGGEDNTANNAHSAVGGGYNNFAGGALSTIPGGMSNIAQGNSSLAAGVLAYAYHPSSIVLAANIWSEPGNDYISSGGQEQMVLRADSGIYITNTGGSAPFDHTKLINTSTGAYLSAAGVWTNSSDENLKENFTDIDSQGLLEKISKLEITEWNYKFDGKDVRHIGPTSQDFYALFGLGVDHKSISTVDPAGIALAAIKELYHTTQDLKQKTARIEKLESELADLKSLVQQLLSEKR